MKNNFNFTEIYYEFKIKTAFRVFSAYFQDEEYFKDFLNLLSKEKQAKFFRLSKFYNDFVRNPLFKDESTKDYFSLIIIFSLMEATVSEEEHLTFDQYLLKNFRPIPCQETLQQMQEEYFNKFGSQKQVKGFFNNYVDKDCKKVFAHAVCDNSENKKNELSVDKVDKKIKQNVELFYQWRSDFVHHAEMPWAFREASFYMKNKNIITAAYVREDFEQLFEHGFLRYFGYVKNLEHKNIEEKIEKYKHHTFNKAWQQICEKFKNLKINQYSL